MGRIVTTKGLLGVTGRDSNMILRLQHGLICGIRENILKCAAIPVEVELVDLIQQMMQWEPMMRISPSEALEHPYLNGYMICSNF